MAIIRRRGTAIVDTPDGILVTASRNKLFLLPGVELKNGKVEEKLR